MDEKFRTSVEKQIDKPDWDKIESLAETKLKQLNGLISEVGALHIAVNELYPDYQVERQGASGTEVKGRLINKTKPRIVETKKSGKTAVRDIFIATEETGILQSTLWGKAKVELFKNINHGDAISAVGVKIGSKDGKTVLNFFDNSTVEKLADGEVKALSEMLESVNIEEVNKSKIGTVSGIILQVKDIELRTCPTCNSKLTEVEDTYICPTHQEVVPIIKKAKDITIDTGNGIIQTVLWPEVFDEGKEPKQLDKIDALSRVYDKNFYAREKASQESEATAQVIAKQFPKQLKMDVYSYSLEQIGTKADASEKKTAEKAEEPSVEEEDVKDSE